MELMAQFCKALGLSAEAEEGEVLAAVQRHGDFARELVKLSGEQPGPALLGTIAAWKHAETQTAALRDELTALKSDGRKREVETMVRHGLESGQLSPAQKEWALSLGSSDDGMIALRKYFETAPRQVQTVEKAQPPTVVEKKAALTREAIRIARMCGNDPEAVAKFAAEHPLGGAQPDGWDDDEDDTTSKAAG